jgi:nitronate monooxygenase
MASMKLPELKIGNLISALPIVQGGMGVGISMSGLASAVAEAGGVGVIAAAMAGITEKDVATNGVGANTRALTREIRKARANTKGVLGVNIMVALTHFADLVKTAIDEKIDVIFSGAGLPLDLPAYLKTGVRTKLVPIVSSARAAKLICRKWLGKYNYLPDAFVVEGPMAGGHLGFKAEEIFDPRFRLENLIKEVVETVKGITADKDKQIPVIAAGGVYTGDDIRRFLELGASGVQMGTRFVATHECDADPAFKQAFLDAGKDDVTIIKSPVGMPGRAVDNAFLREVAAGHNRPFNCPYHCIKTCNPEKSPYCIAMALARARKGKLNHGFAFAGQNVHRVNEIMSVKELLASLSKEYQAATA